MKKRAKKEIIAVKKLLHSYWIPILLIVFSLIIIDHPNLIPLSFIFSLVGSIWGISVTRKLFQGTLLERRKYLWAIPLAYVFIFLFLSLLFTSLQAGMYARSLGYIKYAPCDNAEVHRTLTPSEIASLPGFVDLDRVKWTYYNLVTLTGLGYGDMCPQGDMFRLLAMFEALAGMFVNVVYLSLVVRSVDHIPHRTKKQIEKAQTKEWVAPPEKKK